MKNKLIEETILFASILKWVFLATVIGTIVGVAAAFFLTVLNISISFGEGFPYLFLLLPFAFFLSSALVKYLAPDAHGHGTEKVIEAIHKRSGRISFIVVPVKALATIITLAFGGSAGKEGPCAQIGAGLSSSFADLLRFNNHDRRKLVICGISAGFASVFGTPIAGAIFGVEVLYVGGMMYDVLLPSFIAGITSYQVTSSLGISYFHNPIEFAPVFSEVFFLKIILAGLFFGLCAFLLIETMKIISSFSSKIRIWKPYKGLIGGALLIGLTMIFTKQYLGLGINTLEATLQGERIVWYAFLMKILFTSITLGFEGSGGIITPIFFIGATAGSFFAELFHLDLTTFSAIGMVSLLAGATNTPIAASILAIELFGPSIAPYAAVACVISFLITGHRSVYPSQILDVSKSNSIHVSKGREMETVKVKFRPSSKKLGKKFLKMFNERT